MHYLRNLCGEKSTVWRDKMDELLTAENPPDERTQPPGGAVQPGLPLIRLDLWNCTESAALALKNYTREGEGLTKEIVLRYGN